MARPALMEIVRRAYALWQQHGKPEGRDDEFYRQAESDLMAAAGNSAGEPASTDRSAGEAFSQTPISPPLGQNAA